MTNMFCYNCGVEIKREHKFCFSCGIRLEFNNPGNNGQARIVKSPYPTSERSPEKNIDTPERLKSIDIKDLFKKMEIAVKKESSLSDEEFEKNWGRFKKYHYKNYLDNAIYWILVQVAFYSGMKAATVTEKLPAIKKYFNDYATARNYSEIEVSLVLKDPNTIHYKRKIEACINNAIKFDKLIKRHGTFSNYIESFGNLQDDKTIDILKKDCRFRLQCGNPQDVVVRSIACFMSLPLLDKGQGHRSGSRWLPCSAPDFGIHRLSS